WRLLLARPRPPPTNPPLRPLPRRTHRLRRRSHSRAIAIISIHAGLPDSVCHHRPSSEETENVMKAVFVEQIGGPENIKYGDQPKPTLQPGQALVKLAAAGVNFIDIYFRTGLYQAPPPIILGSEGAGTVEEVAPDVTTVKPGDRVVYAMARG